MPESIIVLLQLLIDLAHLEPHACLIWRYLLCIQFNTSDSTNTHTQNTNAAPNMCLLGHVQSSQHMVNIHAAQVGYETIESTISGDITNMQMIRNSQIQSLRCTRCLYMHENVSATVPAKSCLKNVCCGSVCELVCVAQSGQCRARTLRASNSRRAGWYCS